MDRKKLVLLIGALIIAIGTAFAARTIFAGGAAPAAEAAQPTGPRVLVAKRALPAGTIITADALGFQPWPKELVKDAYFIDGEANMEELLGTVVRYPVTAGEPVTQGSLVSPGDRGFLAAALAPGMRAVTVPVSAMTGVGGFVFPGDRVDLVLSQEIDDPNDGPSLKTAETILRNLRVLATDQTTETTTDENGKTVVTAFRTVTLEVTPKMAEKVAVGQVVGTLSLALRSLGDDNSELERAIAAGSVNIPANATPEQEEKLLKAAMARPIDNGVSSVTGGDVSRFQRSNMALLPTDKRGGQEYTPPAPGISGRINNEPVYKGPSVRVTRGKATEETPVSAQSVSGGMLRPQANGTRRAGQVVSSAMGN
jgi:pilus assembly protein CpaB